MASQLLSRLRQLRDNSKQLANHLTGDLKPFGFGRPRTFKWMPDAPTSRVSVATTCTGIMAAVVGNRVSQVFDIKDSETSNAILDTLRLIHKSPWNSSDLPDNNAFTTAMVGRTTGILAAHRVVDQATLKKLERTISGKTKTLEEILRDLASGVPSSLSVQGYPPTPTIGYWLVDALDSLDVELGQETWTKIANWTAATFAGEFSRVVAKHDALMDPISLAMATCLSMRLKRICRRDGFPGGHEISVGLPSLPEMVSAFDYFRTFQGKSGIWPKYFPLFHYPAKGANYCLSFEVLEALIYEFGSSSILTAGTGDAAATGLEMLDQAVRWCALNRVTLARNGATYAGWNSGGDRLSLESGEPEFWATGVTHMFLSRLLGMLRESIQREILDRYRVRVDPVPDATRWNALIDVDVPMPSEGGPRPLKSILEEEMVSPIEAGQTCKRRSALLFGPPGTSKTTLVRALARRLGWPCVELDPSHFLRDGLESIYARAQDVFDDMSDLTRVVILFDEIDALVQRRDEHLDVTRLFLTTSMLPRLAKLHGAGDVLFFFATNHLGYFDDAIKRPGRFDLLLLVQPPKWSAKLERFDLFCEADAPTAVVDASKALLSGWVTVGDDTAKALDSFTVDELASVFEHVRRTTGKPTTSTALETFGKNDFRHLVGDWHAKFITLRKQNESVWKEFERDLESSRRQ